jgi:hypothetical protein
MDAQRPQTEIDRLLSFHAAANTKTVEEIVKAIVVNIESSRLAAAQRGVRVLYRVAKQSSAEEWQDFIVSGDLPIVQLTPQELELARGGYGWILDIVAKPR